MIRLCQIFLFFTLLSIACDLLGQSEVDTTMEIELITIRETQPKENTIGEQTISFEDEQIIQQQSLVQLLQRESGIHLKSYGLGSLSTSSIRGGAAGHLAVTWNGLAIESPMLGLLDLSQLPIQFSEKISLHKGGKSGLWGSGAIGGVLALENENQNTNELAVFKSTIGSFGLLEQNVKLNYQLGKFSFSTRFLYGQSDNDFTYQVRADKPIIEQSNNAFKQAGILQSADLQINKNQNLQLYYWKQYARKEIPPLTTQTISNAFQIDESDRLMLDWKKIGDQVSLVGKIGVFRESIDYNNQRAGIAAKSNFTNYIAEGFGERYVNDHHKILFGLNYTKSVAFAEEYQEEQARSRISIFGKYHMTLDRLQMELSVRQEWSGGTLAPFVPSLAWTFPVTQKCTIEGKISRNYRLPTLNDLYWRPGGNPDLKSEEGWSQELTIKHKYQSESLAYKLSLTAFHRDIQNWIFWSQREGEFIFSPQNIARVKSSGIEPRFQIMMKKNDWSVDINSGYNYILSTNQTAVASPSIEEGSQLWYVPKHKIFGSINFQFKQFGVDYYSQYTGDVETLSDPLVDYSLSSFSAYINQIISRQKIQLRLDVENIWDQSYRVVERRPMAGRHVRLHLILHLK